MHRSRELGCVGCTRRGQADRNEGKPAIASPLVIAFHSRLADAYAQDRATT